MIDLDQVTHYPLCWPLDRKRTPPKVRGKSRYGVRSIDEAIGEVDQELRRWRIRDYVISSEVRPMTRREPEDPAVALWFKMPAGHDVAEGAVMVFPADKFVTVRENLRAISLTMQRLRLVAEIGVYTLGQAMEGAKALPPPPNWRQTLEIGRDATLQDANSAYKRLALRYHPDNNDTGSDAKMAELNAAIEAARQELAA